MVANILVEDVLVEDTTIVSEEAEEQTHKIEFKVMTVVANFLERVVQFSHSLSSLDVHRVLLLQLHLATITSDEAKEIYSLVELVERELKGLVSLQVIKSKRVKVANLDVFGQVVLFQSIEVVSGLLVGSVEVFASTLHLN